MTQSAQTAAERRLLILCADDFAMTAGVSQAILSLLEHGRLSATCAMT
ncbi:MAG: ChbG/HpnK family deacetylase, partial [Beijerinckiaceae bacterium]